MSQPPARPWFRLASIARPAPPPPTRPPTPAPLQQPTFRPPIPLPQPTQAAAIPPRTSAPPSPTAATVPPRASAPPSPTAVTITTRASAPPSPIPPTKPAPRSSPVASQPPRATAPPSSPPPQATASPSPAKTPLDTLTSTETESQKSPAKNGGSQPASSITTSPKITTIPDTPHSFLPPSPKAKPSAPPPSPLTTSPAFQTGPSSPAPPQPSPVPVAAPIATVTARATTPVASPKIDKPWVETPPQSAKEEVLSHPLSPLTLPPAQLKTGSDLEPIPAEAEQKTVLLQETEEKSKTTPKTSNGHLQRSSGEALNNSIAQHGRRELKKDKGVHAHKKHSDSEELGIRVVTLAGENKGAIMEVRPSQKSKGSGAWSNGGQKLRGNSDEGNSRMKDEKHKALSTETAPMEAFINCNVQGVNNSILYNCSCSHNDPGVHLLVSRKGNGGHGVHRMKDPVIG